MYESYAAVFRSVAVWEERLQQQSKISTESRTVHTVIASNDTETRTLRAIDLNVSIEFFLISFYILE